MLRATLTFSISLLLISFAWNYLGPPGFSSRYAYLIILYFTLSGLLVHRFLMKTNERSAKDFVRAYLGSTALRLFVNLLVILFGILLDRANAIVFTMSFLFFYFCFLVFEIIMLQKDLKGK